MGPAIAAAGAFWTPFALGSSLQDRLEEAAGASKTVK